MSASDAPSSNDRDSELIICGNTETAGDINRRWAHNDVTWRFDGNFPGIPTELVLQVMETAAQLFNSKCGLRMRMTSTGESPDVRIVTTRLDGPFGVLADMELPHVRDPSTKRMRFDAGDRFVISNNPQRPSISLRHVFEHELGHAVGLPHGGGGRMAPAYNLSDPLDPWTIGGLIERYGPPEVTPSDPPPAPPDIEDIILYDGGHYEILLRRK